MSAADAFAGLEHIVGLGVEKCGTTSLVELLARVPGLLTPRRKETFFFNRHFEAGAAWYRDLFPAGAGARAFIDFTPSYFRSPEALRRLAAFPTRKKLLLLLRHPVQRAYSHYLHEIYNHIGRGEGVARDFARPAEAGFARFAAQPGHHFITRYADIVETVGRLLPGTPLLVLTLEALEQDREAALRRLEGFLELDLATARAAPLPRLNRSYLPSYLAPRRARLLWQGGRPWRLRAGHLYLLLRERPLDLGPRPPEQRANALRLAASFTRGLERADCETLHGANFAADVERTARLTGLDLGAWHRQEALRAEELRPRPLALW